MKSVQDKEYREARLSLLQAYCRVVKLKFPDAEHIVGIATESGMNKWRSEDTAYLDAREWSRDEQEEAKELQKNMGLLTDLRIFKGTVKEYPLAENEPKKQAGSHTKRYPRNAPCPCGSGKKFKKCCGNPVN